MRTLRLLLCATVLCLFSAAALAGPAELKFKAGDKAYICACGEKCGCKVVSKKAGKCGCGHDLTEVAVTKVEGQHAFYKAGDKESSFGLKGKYTCACTGDCCQMISQKAGKCPCGKDLIPAAAEKKAAPQGAHPHATGDKS